jgi:hypothetical protein
VSEVNTIGLDLAKSIFQVPAADQRGDVVFRTAEHCFAVLCASTPVYGCDGGMCWVAARFCVWATMFD